VRLKPAAIEVAGAWEVNAFFDKLIAELSSALTFRSERIRSLLALIATTVLRLHASTSEGKRILSPSQRQRILDLAGRHVTGRLSVREMARELRLSPVYFTRLFRETFGVSPRRWLVDERMRHAAQLLAETNLNVSEVAYRLGYSDIFLFSRQFKKSTGSSPRSFRRQTGPSQP
jgi:AraC family transcriptional regulator